MVHFWRGYPKWEIRPWRRQGWRWFCCWSWPLAFSRYPCYPFQGILFIFFQGILFIIFPYPVYPFQGILFILFQVPFFIMFQTPGLETIEFIKRSIKEMVGFWGDAQNEKSGPGGAREMIDFIKRSIKEMLGLWGSAQNEKSGSGDARARNDRVYKEKY